MADAVTTGRWRGTGILGAALIASAAWVADAHATFPGRNGPLLVVTQHCGADRCRGGLTSLDEHGRKRAVPRRLRHLAALYVRPGVAFAPSGRFLAIQSRDRAYWGRANGRGTWRSRTALGSRPAWTPGGRLAYNCDNRRICTVDRKGRHRRFIARGYDPDWSVRGDLAVVRDTPWLPPWIVVIGRNGVERQLTLPSENCIEPSWAPDGRELAFTCFPSDPPGSVVTVIRPDGTGRRVLADGSAPAWSPDGRRIAFLSQFGVMIAQRAGGEARLLRRLPSGGGLAWRPLPRRG